MHDHSFQAVLALVYADLLEFHRRAYKFVRMRFELWLKENGANALLWLCGKPGAGKRVLCSSLIQFLESRKINVFNFFCSYRDTTTINSTLLLRSFALQAIQKNPDLAVYIHNEVLPTWPIVSRRALMGLIPKVLQSVGSARLVVDGLDEWAPGEQSLMLEDLFQLLSSNPSSHICKIPISSRDVPTIS
ncbi:hypothetical protein K505DRAFT_393493 [Melanomma pulvis-pyrius CBS 109.77]|uniref:Nephrocystin 3-like N-terminal domain-containing protein n=1 Tax=Melanomma pulvis-pyrius CBS 109.77 TaxID=1314802 RepID=A0A6A6WYE2_9PLEO|nr:hypothetical protein K505DRAFT_393493 [Melanomma pulvis-pyrius CBS 109.77]